MSNNCRFGPPWPPGFSFLLLESSSHDLELREKQLRFARYNIELTQFNIESTPNDQVIVEFNMEFRGSDFESARNNHVIAQFNIEFGQPWIEFG